MSTLGLFDNICKVCGNHFQAIQARRQFCSEKCWRHDYKARAYILHKAYVSTHPKARYKGSADYWKDLIKELLGSKCTNCGAMDRLEIDHILPEFMGGKHTLSNLQLLCHKCHIAKTNRMRWTKATPLISQ
jgi:5-methylcytosine-specific restriction endonuclease McrA